MSRALLFSAGCLCFAILLGLPGAIYAPDAGQYRLLALGQRNAVPAPFSARILGPATAGWLGRVTGLGVDTGFLLLGIVCLVALIALVAGLLWSWRAPIAIFAGVFLMPFWVDIFHDYYLPDLLHATILAAILLCLFYGHNGLALLLLFPAYLARESTLLLALCLLFACWRRIPLRTAGVGFLAMAAGLLVSRHYGQSGPASVHGLGGGAYILGKLFWSFFKNVLGLPLWSNTLPECSPVWVTALPHSLGAIRQVGVCRPSAMGAWAPPPRLVRHLRDRPRPGGGPVAEDGSPPLRSGAGSGAHSRHDYCLPFLRRLRSHQHLNGTAPRGECRPAGGVWVALLLWRAPLVHRRVVRPPWPPLGLDPSAAPAHLLGGLVRLQAADTELPARRPGGAGLERGGLRPAKAVLWAFHQGFPAGNLLGYPQCG